MTGNELRQKVCDNMSSWIGATKGSAKHKEILSIYNNYTPLAVGYTVKESDAYCAATVSAAFIKAGIAAYTGTECSVPRFITVAQNKGIWVEDDAYVPKPGDALCYDWDDDGIGDNTGSPDHIGIITAISGNNMTVAEGNMSGGKTGTRSMTVNGKYIRGYIVPDYDAIAKALSGGTASGSTATSTTLNGIDVSEYNGNIDWAKVKAAGIQFAIIRTGYGKSYVDPKFHQNIKGAIAQGIPVGVYHFSYALDVAGAKAEAAHVLNIIKDYKSNITLPVFYDFEYDTIRYGKDNGVTLGKTAFINHTVAFCDAIKAAGYTPGTYYNLDYYNNYYDKSKLGGYAQWYAQYASSPKVTDYLLWQYSSSGSVSGISGRVDMNQMKVAVNAGWKKNSVGWWYVHADGSYTTSGWEQINGEWYYFDDQGYMVHDVDVEYDGKIYSFDSDGHVTVTEKTTGDTSDSMDEEDTEMRFYKLGEVTQSYYRKTLDKLVEKGYLVGRDGEGDDMVIDLGEDTVRTLVILDRAGVFDK